MHNSNRRPDSGGRAFLTFYQIGDEVKPLSTNEVKPLTEAELTYIRLELSSQDCLGFIRGRRFSDRKTSSLFCTLLSNL